MGLLDEAIREHLELKRLRGADPGEVAREEREALEILAAQSEGALPSQIDDPGSLDAREDASVGASPEHTAQETAEVDMRAILEEELDISTGSESEKGRFSVRKHGEDPEDPALESGAGEEATARGPVDGRSTPPAAS
jgi:hypothetical protein